MIRTAVLLSLAATLTSCATRDTPGAGYGAEYTPVIDMQGVDQRAYGADLAACRNLANTIDANKAAMEGGIAGAFVGALVSGALRGGRQTTIDSANIGAMSGMGQAGGQAMAEAKKIIINCMVGRGYRALEVTPGLGTYRQPIAAVADTAPAPMAQPGAVVALPSPAANPKPPAMAGQFSYEAERIPEARACAAMPQASLVTKGAGFELYSIACRNSDTIMVRCEMGNCRAMR